MAYRTLADVTIAFHLAFVVFVAIGGLLAARWPRVAWGHVPAAIWAAWAEFTGWACPLTPLENWLRAQGGRAVYTSGFIEEYLLPLVYPAALSREVQWMLGSAVLLSNATVYAVILRRKSRRGRTSGTARP